MASRISRIKSQLTAAQAEALCHKWIPGGVRKGRAYVVKSPFRNENTPSFYVYLEPTIGFYDYGGGNSGDMIDLCQRLFNVELGEALEAFEQMLGIEREIPERMQRNRGGDSRVASSGVDAASVQRN